MKEVITVFDEYGNSYDVEVLDIFEIEGYDHEYIMYTRNQENYDENTEAFVSIIRDDNDSYSLVNIEDEEEWNVVQRAILEAGE